MWLRKRVGGPRSSTLPEQVSDLLELGDRRLLGARGLALLGLRLLLELVARFLARLDRLGVAEVELVDDRLDVRVDDRPGVVVHRRNEGEVELLARDPERLAAGVPELVLELEDADLELDRALGLLGPVLRAESLDLHRVSPV